MASSSAVATIDELDSDGEEFYECSNDTDASSCQEIAATNREDNDDTDDDGNGGGSSRNDVIDPESLTGVRALVDSGCYGNSCRGYSVTRTGKTGWRGRSSLPATMVSRSDFSLWSFLRQCIGKELSKITMPIVFNEPVSFLQRIVEYMEYATSLLERASACQDPIERMELVTAFAVSATASNWERIGKPFNPLLGETYELDRWNDFGFRVVCEQVEHHPPISAFHVEAPDYTFHGTIYPKIKFWGSSIQVTPKGLVTLYLRKHDEAYSWQNVSCTVHNVIVGRIWVEHSGEMEVNNWKTNHRSVLTFKPCGWSGSEIHKVQGYMYDKRKRKVRSFYGRWTEALYSCEVEIWERFARTSWKDVEQSNQNRSNDTDGPNDVPQAQRGMTCNLNIPDQKLLWMASLRPDNSSRYYNFTLFAMMLNEIDPQQVARLPPTDCRLRPDLRLLEQADVEKASEEKNRVEEKQRRTRKDRARSREDWKPRWFKVGKNKYTGSEEWQFTGNYWKRDWTSCPDIF